MPQRCNTGTRIEQEWETDPISTRLNQCHRHKREPHVPGIRLDPVEVDYVLKGFIRHTLLTRSPDPLESG